jgi:DNA-binding MarR family transcriptional regulator
MLSARHSKSQRPNMTTKPATPEKKTNKAGYRVSVEQALKQWHSERPELDLGPLGVFAALAHAYGLSNLEIERLMGKHGLNRGTFDVLTTLRRAGPPFTLGPKQLATSLLLSGAGMTNRLDQLEKRKLVRRMPDPSDRRALKIQLTSSGLKFMDKILPELIAMESDLASGLSKKKLRMLTILLDELAQKIELNSAIERDG